MKLTDLNRHGGIGSNCLHLQIEDMSIVIDCGFHPKKMGLDCVPEVDVLHDHTVDLVILTHCHLDHLGALPILLRRQPQAEVLCSLPTQTLAPRMLHNSCNVMQRQKEEHRIPELPLYSHHEIDHIEHQFTPMKFGHSRYFSSKAGNTEVEITLFPAGHIVGAVGVQIVHKRRKIFLTGDVLFTPQETISGAKFPEGPFDTLVIETTHGAKEREAPTDRKQELERLVETIEHTHEHGGSTLIPVFALGRMQELLAVFHRMHKEQGRLKDIPIFCAGLGMDLAGMFDQIAKKTGLINFRKKIMKELDIRKLPTNLTPGKDPGEQGLYLVSSGMLVERTPSYKVLASLLHEHSNTICFVGYCDPETPGGELLATAAGDPFLFEVFDYACPARARIERFELSGHAERDELIDFAVKSSPRAIVLSHGDPDAREWFETELAIQGFGNVINPKPLTTVLV